MTENVAQAAGDRLGFILRENFQKLIDILIAEGYNCLGPVVNSVAVQYEAITRVDELAAGVTVEQMPGHYKISASDSPRLFSWSNGPQALKPLLFSPREAMWRTVHHKGGRISFEQITPEVKPTAVIGVRACDLAALALQDQHFLHQDNPDPQYQARRSSLFLIGVDCAYPSATCFCASTGDGPAVLRGFDLGMTELSNGFLIRAESEAGDAVISQLELLPATAEQISEAVEISRLAASVQQRSLPRQTSGQSLYSSLHDRHWDEIGDRCLACGNCTSVCPTCFCYSAHAELTLDGRQATQFREWDSCFSPGHSSLHGHPLRKNISTRYRQWLTHKLTGWKEQFGRIGCVGCGRCITWCPAGIDITQEALVLLEGTHRD